MPVVGTNCFVHGQIYKIVNVGDGNVLDVAGSGSKPGTKLLTYVEHSGTNQKFKAVQRNTGFRLIPLHMKGETVILDHHYDNDVLYLYDTHDGVNQQFLAEEVNPGSNIVRIRSMHAFKYWVGRGHGNQVAFTPTKSSDPYQFWKLIATSEQAPSNGAFKDCQVYKIKSVVDGNVLDVSEGSTQKLGKLVPWTSHNGGNQKFKAVKVGNGFRLSPMHAPGLILDHNIERSVLYTWTINGNANQEFIAEEMFHGSGIVRIRSLHSRKYLRNNGKGQHVSLVAPDHNDESQLWRLDITS